MNTRSTLPEYPAFPPGTILGLTWALLSGQQRSFRQDALACTHKLRLVALGKQHIPQVGPGVLLVNHYYRPAFFAAWIALAVSACVPQELNWVMTAAWTATFTTWSQVKASLSTFLFPRLAQVYHFIPMPPMPPRPQEVVARAQAVRQILAVARHNPPPLLAIAPEGMDPQHGRGLIQPPPGVGRMLVKLAHAGCHFYPVGVFEDEDALVVNFGPGFSLPSTVGLAVEEVDRLVTEHVMCVIATQLPIEIRGKYSQICL